MRHRIVRLFFAISLVFVVSACDKPTPTPTLSQDGKNEGLLANINCSSDKFSFTLEKQKTDLFQIYRNGEYVSDLRHDSECKIDDIFVSIHLALDEKETQRHYQEGSFFMTAYNSPSYILVQKSNTQIAKIHVYQEERMFNPLKILQVNISSEQIIFCDNAAIKPQTCNSYKTSNLLLKPIEFQHSGGFAY